MIVKVDISSYFSIQNSDQLFIDLLIFIIKGRPWLNTIEKMRFSYLLAILEAFKTISTENLKIIDYFLTDGEIRTDIGDSRVAFTRLKYGVVTVTVWPKPIENAPDPAILLNSLMINQIFKYLGVWFFIRMNCEIVNILTTSATSCTSVSQKWYYLSCCGLVIVTT